MSAAFHRSTRWRSASLETRVREWKCAVCGLEPSRPSQLEAAHLVSVFEIRRDFPYNSAALLDEANVVAMCHPCHRAYDTLLVGVFDARLLGPSQKGKSWKRIALHLPAFAALLGQRARFRARCRRERAEAEPGAPTPPLDDATATRQLAFDSGPRMSGSPRELRRHTGTVD